MKTWKKAIGSAMVMLCAVCGAHAATPGKIKYQGLLRSNGAPVTGQKTVSFGLFTQATGGTAVWESGDIAVNVSNGVFSCELTPSAGIDWSAGPYYVQVTVDGTVMVPREEITSTVYALQARSVDDGAVTTAKLADGAVTGGKLAAGSVTDDKVVSVSWSKVTGVGNIDATGYSITASTIGSPGTKLYGDGSALTNLPGMGGSGDNLGNHTATQNLNLAGNAVVNASSITAGTSRSEFKLTLGGDGGIMARGEYGSGAVLTSTGVGARMFWYPRKAAFRAGWVGGTQWDDANIGEYSVALGRETTASGFSAIALGDVASATGNGAVAFGYNAVASGTVSVALGYGPMALGYASTALGNWTIASGGGSIALGDQVWATAQNSMVMGRNLINNTTDAFMVGFHASGKTEPGLAVVSTNNLVGIGTAMPEFKLTLDGDGGIMAKGMFGSGAVLTSTGVGPRMFWYPRKAAFRAGFVGGSQWNDVNIGEFSTALGVNTIASGDASTALGYYATASGNQSTALGMNTTASGMASTALGRDTLASGMVSTALGYYTRATAQDAISVGTFMVNNATSSFMVGFYTTHTTTPTLAVIGMTDRVGVNTANPTRKLFVNGDAGGTTAWSNDSDERLKKDIATIRDALAKVKKLRGVTYEWKDTTSHPAGRQMGLIAQEAKDVIPEVVDKPGEYYSMQYGPIVALLIEAIKEQAAENERLAERNRMLEERLRAVEQRLGVR